MIKIVLEDDVFVTKNTNIVDTKMHVVDNECCFPSQDWTDFTFPVLEWWKNNMINARYLDNHSFRLPFHDGPFWLDVYKDDSMGMKIECVNGRGKKKIELSSNCGYYDFLQELYTAFKIFAKILHENNMHEGDFSSIYRQTLHSINELKEILE